MRVAHQLLPFLTLFSLACGLVVPVPTATPLPATATQTASPTATFTITPDIAATETIAVDLTELSHTATPSPTVTPTIAPGDLVEAEMPLPPPAVSPGASYELADELLIDAYGIRFWHETEDSMGFSDVLLIEKAGVPSIRIEMASAIAELSGTDINGDGLPEVIIETYSGGAHCCFGTQVYSLGEQPTLILQKPESNAGGNFEDLDNDGVYEFVTHDDLFAYQYCPYAGSPFVKAIMAYEPNTEIYVPANSQFPDEYEERILQDTERAENAQPGDFGEWDETTKCGVLGMALDYIYLGDLEKGKTELQRVYPYSDVETFWDELMLQVQGSPLYAIKEDE